MMSQLYRNSASGLLACAVMVVTVFVSGAVGCSISMAHDRSNESLASELPVPDPIVISQTTPTVLEKCGVDPMLLPHGLFAFVTQAAGNGPQLDRVFDVYTGSTKVGNDVSGVERATASSAKCNCTNPAGHVADPTGTIDLGNHVQLNTGFALVSGKAPVVMARRVRAVSDGTQFAVEIVGGTTRIYLIEMASNATSLRVAPDSGGIDYARFVQADVGKYVEIDANNKFVLGKAAPITCGPGTKEEYFYDQMVKLVSCIQAPRPASVGPDGIEKLEKPVVYESLKFRFYRQCGVTPPVLEKTR